MSTTIAFQEVFSLHAVGAGPSAAALAQAHACYLAGERPPRLHLWVCDNADPNSVGVHETIRSVMKMEKLGDKLYQLELKLVRTGRVLVTYDSYGREGWLVNISGAR